MKNDNLDLNVRIRKVADGNKTKAYASVNIAGAFAVTGLRIIDGSKGLFVAMPSQKNHKGEYEDTFFPISKESREALQTAVLSAYEQSLEQKTEQKTEQKQAPAMSM